VTAHYAGAVEEVVSPPQTFDGQILLGMPLAEIHWPYLRFQLPYLQREYASLGDKLKVIFALNNASGKFIREIEDFCLSRSWIGMEYLGRFEKGGEAIVASRNFVNDIFDKQRFSHLYFLDVDTVPSPKPTKCGGILKPEPFPVAKQMVEMLDDIAKRRGCKVGAVGGRYHMKGVMKDPKEAEKHTGVKDAPVDQLYSTARVDLDNPDVRRQAEDKKEPYIEVLGLPFGFTMFPRAVAPHLEVSNDYKGYGTEDYSVMDNIRAAGYKLFLSKELHALHMVYSEEHNIFGAY